MYVFLNYDAKWIILKIQREEVYGGVELKGDSKFSFRSWNRIYFLCGLRVGGITSKKNQVLEERVRGQRVWRETIKMGSIRKVKET